MSVRVEVVGLVCASVRVRVRASVGVRFCAYVRSRPDFGYACEMISSAFAQKNCTFFPLYELL